MTFCFVPHSGTCLGIAQRLAFEEKEIFLRNEIPGGEQVWSIGIARGDSYPPGTCVIPEIWRYGLSEDLLAGEGSPRLLDFAKRAGLLMGNSPSRWYRVGVLVWYRRGIPIPPAFLILQDSTHLAGGWGTAAAPSALAVPVASPGKAYSLTHGRVGPLFKLAKITGPVLAWHRIGVGGVDFLHFEPRLGGLPGHACLELLDVDLDRFLLAIYSDESIPPPYFREDRIGAAVRVSVPPWPTWNEYGLMPEVEFPAEPWIWPMDLSRDETGALWVGGMSFVVADVTASDPDPLRAAGQALWRARSIKTEGAQARSDALEFTPQALHFLDKRGYLK